MNISIDIGSVIEAPNGEFILLLSRDFAKNEVVGKVFKSLDDVQLYLLTLVDKDGNRIGW